MNLCYWCCCCWLELPTFNFFNGIMESATTIDADRRFEKWLANVGFDATVNLIFFDFGCAKGSGANKNRFRIRMR